MSLLPHSRRMKIWSIERKERKTSDCYDHSGNKYFRCRFENVDFVYVCYIKLTWRIAINWNKVLTPVFASFNTSFNSFSHCIYVCIFFLVCLFTLNHFCPLWPTFRYNFAFQWFHSHCELYIRDKEA